jgi:hypothetical protein
VLSSAYITFTTIVDPDQSVHHCNLITSVNDGIGLAQFSRYVGLFVTLHEIFGPAALTSFFRNRCGTKIIKLRFESGLQSQFYDLVSR